MAIRKREWLGRIGGALSDTAHQGASSLAELSKRLRDVSDALVEGRPPRVGELTYPAVVEFFVENRDRAPQATSGALVRETKGGELYVRLFYLDDDGQPMVGPPHDAPHRSYIVTALDEQLVTLLGTNDVLLFT